MRRTELDTLRGAALVNMIAYHALWDMVYLFGADIVWFRRSIFEYLWQQAICWTFILLSGYCFHLGRRTLRRGITVWLCGAVITLITVLFLPHSAVRFGILTFLGTAMLLTHFLRPLLARVPAAWGLALSAALFFLLRNVNSGTLGFEGLVLAPLPQSLYRSGLTAFFGFPPPEFFSADYFSCLPWLFLFWCGWFFFRLCPGGAGSARPIPVLTWVGRRSLLIYMAHQPCVYAVLYLLYTLF